MNKLKSLIQFDKELRYKIFSEEITKLMKRYGYEEMEEGLFRQDDCDVIINMKVIIHTDGL